MMDDKYLEILIGPIRVCSRYRPKFGKGGKAGLTLREFRQLYGSDPFYSWFGLDHPLVYAAHKAAGGITSVYRQIGIGVERLFREILKDTLFISDQDVQWSYSVDAPGGRKRTLSLDARIPLERVKDTVALARVTDWISRVAADLGVERSVRASLQGAVFEVRQGYKSKDSKRQNADIANAATAYTKGYLPCVVVLSAQIDEDIQLRYRNEKWGLLTGHPGARDDILSSTYAFMESVIGYDLAGFFERNSETLRSEVENVLNHLLAAEGDGNA